MTSVQESQNVLKADSRGRVRGSKQRREALLDEYEKSGLSGPRFARLAGLKYSTFAAWARRRRLARARQAARPSVGNGQSADGVLAPRPIQLVEALVECPAPLSSERSQSSAALTVELPGNARVQVGSPLQLQMTAELLAMLEQSLRRPC